MEYWPTKQMFLKMSIDIPLHKNSLFQPPFDKRNDDIIRRQTSYLQTIKLRFFTSDDLSLSSAIFHIWILIMTQSFNLLQSDSNGSVVFFSCFVFSFCFLRDWCDDTKFVVLRLMLRLNCLILGRLFMGIE